MELVIRKSTATRDRSATKRSQYATGNPTETFRDIGRGGFEGVPVLEVLPYPLLIMVVLAVFCVWLSGRPYGRTLVATGDNPDAAAFSGSRVWLVKTQAFVKELVDADLSYAPPFSPLWDPVASAARDLLRRL